MQLYYKEAGSGKPLIILHGLFGMSDNFMSIASSLASDFHVFTVDQRNHGQSGHSSVFSYKAMSDDLLQFMEEKQLTKAHLLGHSMGGKTAMQFAFYHPEKVNRLIVADMTPAERPVNSSHHQLIELMLEIDPAKYSGRVELAKMLEEKIPSFRLRQFILKNVYWKNKDQLGWRLNLATIYENLHEMFRAVNHKGQLPNPTLFLKGELSDYIQETDIDLIKRLFTNVEILTFPGASHWLHADNPAFFTEAVRTFLLKGEES
ncbi:MAG TPA: alpha/beta fold hydrolase [Bacteroidales bacterium]|nr:alpha/beta fold hydrolase [Bacteroidales bacterium]